MRNRHFQRLLVAVAGGARIAWALAAGALLSAQAPAAPETAGSEPPWPTPVPGWVAPEPGEHPRLFFRKKDLPEIRRRAQTPEGRRIVARLKEVLGGGEAMPVWYNASPFGYHGGVPVDRAGLEAALAERPAPKPGMSDGQDSAGQGASAKKQAAAKKAPQPGEEPDLLDEAPVPPAKTKGGKTSPAKSDPLKLDDEPAEEPAAKAAEKPMPDGAYTLSHVAGFGMLYQLTGDKKYAEWARECMELAFRGVRDRDDRYSWANPAGALRAGPSLGWYAVGYDLCYDGWDEAYRTKVAKAIETYNWGDVENLAALARGARHYPRKNHWGGQVGGGALALLAIWKDPGMDNARIESLMQTNLQCQILHLNGGFGDGGYYFEHAGPGGIASDTAFVPGLQAWKVAGGKDFISPRRNASAITLIKCYELTSFGGEPWYMLRHPSGYGTGKFTPHGGDRNGLSRGGQFAQGFGALQDPYKPAVLWVYNHIVEPDPAQRTFDTVSPYPHRAILALVNWPFDVAERNPAEILPRAWFDQMFRYFVFRNQWKDETDLIVSILTCARNDGGEQVMVWGRGMKLGFCQIGTWGTVGHYDSQPDGSAIVSFPKGETFFAVDFSRVCGAELLAVAVGKGATVGKNAKGKDGATAAYTSLTVGGKPWAILTVQTGAVPDVKADGDRVAVGNRTLTFDGQKIVLGPL